MRGLYSSMEEYSRASRHTPIEKPLKNYRRPHLEDEEETEEEQEDEQHQKEQKVKQKRTNKGKEKRTAKRRKKQPRGETQPSFVDVFSFAE